MGVGGQEGGNSSGRKQPTLFNVLYVFTDSSNNNVQLLEQLPFDFLLFTVFGKLVCDNLLTVCPLTSFPSLLNMF